MGRSGKESRPFAVSNRQKIQEVFTYKNIVPVIGRVRFAKEKIIIDLLDGRVVSLPMNNFPDIKKLSASQKRKHKILAGMGLMFDDLDTVYHVSDFLGKTENLNDESYPIAAEPKVKYGKKG